MTVRHRLICLCAFCLVGAAPSEPALRLWEQGQAALRDDRVDDAIRCFQQSLHLDPQLARNYLSLAAAHVARGEEAESARWLSLYLDMKPKHHVVRMQYAELLLRLGRRAEGRAQLERFCADAQERDDLVNQVLDGHTKLMELAEAANDDYGAHLHRGIGLYELARQRAKIGADDDLSNEALLCQAAAELDLARRCRPTEARPCWYLHEVWSALAQQQPAGHWLRVAETAVLFSSLSPAEARALRLACRQRDAEGRRK